MFVEVQRLNCFQAQIVANLKSFDKNVDAAEAMRSVKYLKSDQVNLRE